MLSLASVRVIAFTFVGTMSCHLVSPYVHKCTWKKYSRLKDYERCKVDRYLGITAAEVLCFVFALKAFISDSDFHQLGLVGSSAAGNVALDIMIGQCVSDLLYQRMVEGTFGSIRNVGHHFAAIGGAVVSYYFFHRLAVYRFIHHITHPSIIIYDLMKKLKCDPSGGQFRCVMVVNMCIYFLFRIVVIPLHWAWFIYEIVTSQDEWSEVWLLAWVALIACNIVIDCVNYKWAKGLLKNYREVMDSTWEKEK